MNNDNNILFFDTKLNQLKQKEEDFQLDIKKLSVKERLLFAEKMKRKKQIIRLEQIYIEQLNLISDNKEALYNLDDPTIVRFLNHNFLERKNNESLVHYLSKITGGIIGGVALCVAGTSVTLVYPYVVIPLVVSAGLGTAFYSVFTVDKRKNKKLTKQNKIRFKIRNLEEICERIKENIKLLKKRIGNIDIALRDIRFEIYSIDVNLDILHRQVDQFVEYFENASNSSKVQESKEKGFEKSK